MSLYSLSCPWCKWYGATTGVGDDSPAEFLKEDFARHVQAEHPEYVEVASHIEPEYSDRNSASKPM